MDGARRAEDAPRAEERSQVRVTRLMAARLVLLVALFGAVLALAGPGRDELETAATRGLYGALAAAFLGTAAFGALRGRIRAGAFAAAQIAADVAIATALVYFSGGEQSLFGFLYLLIVVFGAMLFERAGAFGAAALCSSAQGLVLVSVQHGWLHDFGDTAAAPAEVLLATWCVHAGALLVVALLASHLARELHRADARLDQSRSRLHWLRSLHERTVESLMSGLLTTDLEGRLTSFNREAERITGVPVGHALGRDVEEILPGARQRVVGPATASAPGAKLRERMPYRNRRGEDLHLGLSGSILRDEHGAPLGTVVIFQDVTRVVEMEAELRRSERLAAVGKLAASIAHEVRNPLAAISGSIQVLLAGGDQRRAEERRRLSDIVLRETDRLNALITDFLQYAHPRPPRLEPVALARTVADVVQMLENAARPDLKIERCVDAALRVLADPGQLRQLLWNLCANAVQAMPQGGCLRIAAERAAPQAVARGGRNAPEGEESAWVEIRVADTGVGIPPESLERIFDPFFTTKPEGTGLGLATVHRIVEGHGGTLRVESSPGAGTTFSIALREAAEES